MAVDAALFIGWNRPVGGKEAEAVELFTQASTWFGKLQSQGQLAGFKTVLLEAHGGDLNGFMLLEGEVEKLHALKQTDEWHDLITRAAYLMQGFGVNHSVVGDGVAAQMGRYAKVITRK
jgi:hypothetical protein